MKIPWIIQYYLTYFAGWLSQQPWAKTLIIPWFIRRYRVDMSQAIRKAHEYNHFSDFFTRNLKPRDLSHLSHNEALVPVDGRVQDAGILHTNAYIRAKHRDFSVKHLLHISDTEAYSLHEGYFITYYLSPQDYHRVHTPFQGIIDQVIYIPGMLHSVNPQMCHQVSELFSTNERVVVRIQLQGTLTYYYVVFVGAMIVGHITIHGLHNKGSAQGSFKRPFKQTSSRIATYQPYLERKRGEELGFFSLGSTIILIFPPQCIDPYPVNAGQTVHYGASLGQMRIEQHI